MSQFAPTQWTLEPNRGPDHLSAAVLHSLSRPIYGLAWGPIKSLILGGITFGILPLISWPRKFGRYVTAEQQQLWHLVEWLRIRTGEDEAAKLRDSVRQAGPTPTLWIIPLIMLVILAVNFLPWMRAPSDGLRRILSATYLFGISGSPMVWRGHWMYSPFVPRLHLVWVVCLSIAYSSHWLHVQQHAADVNRLVRRLNLILARQHIPAVGMPSLGIGLRPLWIGTAIVGVLFGAWWAIPAAFAGAVHKRYIERTGSQVRVELSGRVQMLLQQQRPDMKVPVPHGLRVVCENELCGKPVPTGAAFCPRCGSRLTSRFGVVA
ncbi:MAG TPA: zinc ribbon domain-containing protein [Tepidisphaeraceae bacterium]|jgi:hypothetical protein|nr:zinc ribbon domain-containing protein [Tepidisphaeraceae bacterium]